MFKISLLICLIGLPFVLSQNYDYKGSWKQFKAKHGKVYSSDVEEIKRFDIFTKNVDLIEKHNKGNHSYQLGINQFADLTNEEFRNRIFGIKRNANRVGKRSTESEPQLNAAHLRFKRAPATMDWRSEGYVTPVKNEGQCGSNWAFSTTGSLEGQYARKTGKLVSFSEQQLVDCSGDFGNNGCNGGLMDNAFQYIQQNGIQREDDYPYEATDDTCRYAASKVVTKISGFQDVSQGDEQALQTAVATVGPVSVAIDASHYTFQLYHSGVYNEPACSSTQVDRGVLVVGYGTDNGIDYWLVKNSWGTSWGMSGYIMMKRNAANQCGIATAASYPLM